MTNAVPGVSILISGSEILDGRVVDTNSHYIATELTRLGIPLHEVVVLSDDSEALLAAIHRLSVRCTHLIMSGGLGPTDDDLTREVVATALGVSLEEKQEARDHIVRFFEERKRIPDPSNFRQALVPDGSSLITNNHGTAPGFRSVFPSGAKLYALPGVPRELRRMFQESVLPEIGADFPTARVVLRKEFRVLGRAEADVGSAVRGCSLPSNVEVSYRASFPEIHVVLKSSDQEALETWEAPVQEALGTEFIVNRQLKHTFESHLISMLEERGHSLALYEGMTAGLMGSRLTEAPGASSVLAGILATYAGVERVHGLVKPREVATHGMVSAEVAKDLAAQTRKFFDASIAVSVLGFAGPGGGDTVRPAGTYFIGFASAEQNFALHYFFPSDRDMVRKFAAYTAFDVIRRFLLGLPMPRRNLVEPS